MRTIQALCAAALLCAVLATCELAPFQTPDGYTCEGSAPGTCASIAQYEQETRSTLTIRWCFEDEHGEVVCPGDEEADE